MEHLYSLIIVDDEEIIREGLSEMVDWYELGYTVVGCFADGREAIEYLKDNHADVVLTDIKMDEVSGIEVAKYVHMHRPSVRTVILSGYQDFAFAQDAIRFRAANYLLKPIDFDELQSVFTEIRRELGPTPHTEGVPQNSARQFASDVVAGKIAEKAELDRQMAALDPALHRESSPAALVLVDFEHSSTQNRVSSLRDGVVTTIRRQCGVSLFEPAVLLNDKIVILIMDTSTADAEALGELIRGSLAKAIESIRGGFQVPIVATVLACENGIDALIGSNPALLVQQALSEHRERRLPERSADEVPFLKRVIDHVEENYATDVSLADAAGLAYLSPVYFGRVFRERVGVPFTEYLAAVRMRKAIELLREQRYKVYEVAKMVGYSSSRYFARVFKKATGYSPKEYRTEVLARELSS